MVAAQSEAAVVRGGWEMSLELDYSGKPRCLAQPASVPELMCRLPDDPAVHLMLGGHIGQSLADGKVYSWGRGSNEPKEVRREDHGRS